MRRLLLTSVLSAGLLVSLILEVVAHPHVWIDARSELVFDDSNRLDSINHVWRFDEAFSAFASQGLDENRDGILSRNELQELAEVNVTSLLEFEYFTFLFVGEDLVEFSEPKDYWLEYEDGFLTLFYSLPIEQPINMDGQVAELQVFDPAYFVAIEMEKEKSFVLVDQGGTCNMDVELPVELEATTVTELALVPAEEELSDQLLSVTETLSNTAKIACA